MELAQLSDFFKVSKQIASRVPFWIQGAGGNTSVKHDQILYVKASGRRLGEIDKPLGLAALNLESSTREFFALKDRGGDQEDSYAQLLKSHQNTTEGWGRPSMETGFHLALPKKYVFHFHALSSILMSEEFSQKPHFKTTNVGNLNVMQIGAIRPGLLLSQTLAENPDFDIYLLKNHGVVLQSDHLNILQAWIDFETDFLTRLQSPLAMDYRNRNCEEILALRGHSMGPFKIYFPDTAVFAAELRNFLIPTGDQFQLPKDFADRSILNEKYRNLVEIWCATLALWDLAPDLPELPQLLIQETPNLPTEKFRKGRP